MLIRYENLKIGDEIIIPSNSSLRYLKVLGINKKSIKCSIQKGVKDKRITWISGYISEVENICQPDISKHNDIYYFRNLDNYVDIWLIKREN